MYHNYKILGVITARGGSKTIPRKNIKLLGGKPLIAYTVEAAKKSKLITHLIISTDSEEIAKIAKGFGIEVPFLRPQELAQDDTSQLPVMQHAINFMEKKLGFQFDYAVILQPTAPFRTVEDVDKTIQLLIDKGADSVVSLVEVGANAHPMKMKKLEDNRVLPYCIEEPEGTRRQDLPKVFKRSGAVYAQKRDLLMEKNKIYGDYIAGYIVPKERSIDIDDEYDWLRAEHMLKQLKEKDYEF